MSRSHKGTKKNNTKNAADKPLKISFSSEALLQQAIARLLNRMPDNYGVQILQGAQELGKDLIFYKRGGFEEPVLHACVVKNAKITGAAEGKGGARTIYIQSEQAFDSVYTDNFGRDVRVERVYVVTPYDLPPETINSIKGKLKERAGQIVFIDGPRLFDLFKKYWPDYFADEAELLEKHLAETKGVYEAESALQGLATQYNWGDVSKYPKKIYVAQNLYRNIYSYELEASLLVPLPTLDRIRKKFAQAEIQFVQDKLNNLRRTVKFLYEWKFCEEHEKESIFKSSSRAITSISDARTKHNLQEEQERLLSEKLEALKTSTQEKDEKEEKKAQQEIGSISKLVNKAAAEKDAEFSVAVEEMKKLDRAKGIVLNRLQENLTKLTRTLSLMRANTLEALGNSSYTEACTLADCVHAAPEGMFKTQLVGKLIFPRDILEKWVGHLLIVGAPGYGKTSFCRWHALQDAENFGAGKSTTIPIYVPLYRFTNSQLGSFEDTFLKNLGKSALFGDTDVSAGIKVRIYLDGLDEIASVDRRCEIVELALGGARGKSKYQIILTSRDYIYAPWLDSFPRITIGGFEEDDIVELVDRWLGKDSESYKRFFQQLDKVPSLYHLMKTPLLATLIIMVFRQTGKLPENRTRLYENFIGLLSGGWDLAKGLLRKSGFGERVKIQVLSTLAANLQEQRRREFYSRDVKLAIKAALSPQMVKDWEALQEEFVIDGLISKSGNLLQFSHHSFQEFLTAKNFMGSPQPTRATLALDAYLLGNDWWKEVIKFYIGLSTNPGEVAEWIASRSKRTFMLESQTQTLRDAMAEAFPEYTSTRRDF